MSTIFAKAVNGVIRTARRRTVQLYSITVLYRHTAHAMIKNDKNILVLIVSLRPKNVRNPTEAMCVKEGDKREKYHDDGCAFCETTQQKLSHPPALLHPPFPKNPFRRGTGTA